MRNKKGFTLIEFIIVMAIIGILVLMAAPKFMDYIRDAKLNSIKNDTKVIEKTLLNEQAKAIKTNKNIDKFFINDTIETKGISKENTELSNQDQGVGIKINPELIVDITNTKLNKHQFYFNEEEGKVFYYYGDTVKEIDLNQLEAISQRLSNASDELDTDESEKAFALIRRAKSKIESVKKYGDKDIKQYDVDQLVQEMEDFLENL